MKTEMKNIFRGGNILSTRLIIGVVSGLILSSGTMAGNEDILETAFQKEFAFLDQQEKALEGQVASYIRKSKKEEMVIKKNLDRLKKKLIDLDIDLENKQLIVEQSTLSIEKKHEDQIRLGQLFEQANSSLEKNIDDKSIVELYRSAIVTLKDSNTINANIAEYFLPDGEKVTGTIINIGRIASYAVGKSGSGMLVPAGDGNMKLWKPENTVTATELISADIVTDFENLNLFLYEDKNQAIEEALEKSIMDIINSGGIIAWIIVLTGGVAIIMVLLRVFFLKRANRGTDKLMLEIKNCISDGKIKDAIDICEKQRGAAARVVTSTLRNLDRERDHLEDIVAESILHENTYLNRYGSAILVVAAAAPLMGLLGTVTGMIETFDIITQFGTGDPKLLSIGISTALVTTQLGLVVAIPALISGNLLSGWSNRIKDNMEQAALIVINLYGLQKIDAVNDKCVSPNKNTVVA